MATWKHLISEEMEEHGETFNDVEASTLTDDDLMNEFDDGYGGSNGCAFTLWTNDRVYFPAVYDGAEWCASVPRNPGKNPEKTHHIGGE